MKKHIFQKVQAYVVSFIGITIAIPQTVRSKSKIDVQAFACTAIKSEKFTFEETSSELLNTF